MTGSLNLIRLVKHRWCLAIVIALPIIAGLSNAASANTSSQRALQQAQAARTLAADAKFEEAIPTARQALNELKTELGDQHPYVAYVADDIARWYFTLGQLDEASQYANQATATIREASGENSTEYAQLLSTLAAINLALGKINQAQSQYQIVLTIYQSTSKENTPALAQAYRNLAVTHTELGNVEEAIELLEKAVSISSPQKQFTTISAQNIGLALAKAYRQGNQVEKTKSLLVQLTKAINANNDSQWLSLQIEKASLNIYQNELTKAETLLLQARDSIDKQQASALQLASLDYQLGFVYILKGQLVEAESVYKQALAGYRQNLSQQHPSIARTLHSLAIVYSNLGMTDLSEKYYQQAIDTHQQALGKDSPSEAATRLEYSLLLSKTGKVDDAIANAQSSLSIFSQLGDQWQLQQGYAHSALGTALKTDGQTAAAITAFEQAKSLMSAARGTDSVDLPPVLTQLAELYIDKHKLQEANRNINAALTIYRKQQANTPFALAKSLTIKAKLQQQMQEPGAALKTANQSVDIMRQRLLQLSGRLRDSAREEQRQSRYLFENYLDIAYPLYQQDQSDLAGDLLIAAQYPIDSGTAAAINRMASRFASKDSDLGSLIKQREDLLNNITLHEQQQTNQLAGISTEKSAPKPSKTESLSKLQAELARIDARLLKQYPDYIQLTSPLPVSIKAVQSVLKAREATFLQLSSNTGSFLFLVTANDFQIHKSDLTYQQLTDKVNAVRDSVDLAKVMSIALMPEFKFREAYALYQGLFAPFADTLKSVDHVVAVFDGAMQNLNPALLLTQLPDKTSLKIKDYPQLDYLINDIAISVAPSLSSLVYLRNLPSTKSTDSQLLGFGDPDLDTRSLPGDGNNTRDLSKIVDIQPEDLRSALSSLPDTRTELETIASVIGKPNSQLFFREKATEAQVKQLDFSPYNILIFATHGLLSGEFMGLNEPSLVMTPPDKGSPLDNGLLTSSEITQLNLQADWVILSACNTAGPDGRPGAEGLSGLAKSFFYAGSKSLLVSHWAVGSEAATYLTTGSFRHASTSPGIGLAEALRRTELELIQGKHSDIYSHPAFWAPFTVVGEGTQSIR